ncbi:MAG: terminase small subunit [Veillonella caviae]|uniref:terminase small subunit n=1 Tax=Veillonella caviae TaxID=248316 RepID=UPI002A91010C|nr:terminase small subunit [Veillonella caviae]MDY5715630.1 terminase small subunit [Veillonella caviae]
MTPKQEKFCVEYLVDLNGAQAAIRAGYAPTRADATAYNLLRNIEVKKRINELRKKEFKATIATAEEAEAFLARAMRGEIEEEVVVTEGVGEGCSEARIIKKSISAKDRIKAAELIGKRNQLFTDKVKVDSAVPIVIIGEGEVYD